MKPHKSVRTHASCRAAPSACAAANAVCVRLNVSSSSSNTTCESHTVQLQPASGNQKRAFDAKRMSTLKQDKKAEIKMMLHEKKLAAAAAERRKKKNPMNAKKKKDDSDDEEEDDDGLDITMSDLPEGARLVSLSYLNQQKQQDRAGRWRRAAVP